MLRPEEQELVSALHSETGVELPMPFERDIFLFGTEIAGTNHVERIHELYESLQEGDKLTLVREPDNPYDEFAIRIETADGEPIGYYPSPALVRRYGSKLGYIPQVNNKIISRLMDAGKLLYGVVRHKEMAGEYHKIVVKVYMKE